MINLRNPFLMFATLAATIFAAPALAQDQERDDSFGDWGVGLYAYASNSTDEALRIFPSFQSDCDEGGCRVDSIYYVAGFTRQTGSSTVQPLALAIDAAGEPLGSFGTNGWLPLPPQLATVDDAAWDPIHRRIYFAGTSFNNDAVVACMDLYAQTMCNGFGILGQVSFKYDTNYESYGSAIVFDADLGLLVSGRARNTSTGGDWVGVARLDPDTGAFNAEFGTGGRNRYSNSPRLPDNRMNVNTLALAKMPDAVDRRALYVGGNFRVDFDVHDSFDGFVLALDGRNGLLIFGYGGTPSAWLPVKSEYQSGINRQDAVTALAVLANGQLAVLGWNEYAGVPGYPGLHRRAMFGRFNMNGTRDTRFCYSEPLWDNNTCTAVQGQAFGATTSTRGAVLEHPGNRDLIFLWSSDVGTAGSSHDILQSSPTFQTRHQYAGFYIDEAANGASDAAWESLAIPRTLYAGWHARRGAPGQREFMVLRALMNDAIFADQFGGASSD